jgi:hypothetical protein
MFAFGERRTRPNRKGVEVEVRASAHFG